MMSRIEFAPLALRPRRTTLESLPKPRPTILGMPPPPCHEPRERVLVDLAFDEAADPEIPITIDPRAFFVAPPEQRRRRHATFRPPRPRASTFVIAKARKGLGRGASLALGLFLGLALVALGAAMHASELVSFLG